MRPTPIPDDEVWVGAVRKVIGPPGGDLFGNVNPVEVLLERTPYGVAHHLRILLEPKDVERIKAGENVFWLSWYADHLHPFNVQMPVRDEEAIDGEDKG